MPVLCSSSLCDKNYFNQKLDLFHSMLLLVLTFKVYTTFELFSVQDHAHLSWGGEGGRTDILCLAF